MAQDFGTPITPMEEPKKQDRTLLIVVVVILVLLCCCCGGAAIMYFWLGDYLMEMLDIQVLQSVLLAI